MFIAKGLLVKGLAGLTAFVGAGGAIAYRKEIKNYFSSKGTSDSPNSAINTKITTLGLPGDCKFPESGSDTTNTKECTLTEDQLKKIKFKNIEGESITISDLANSETITLEIKKFNTPTDEDKKRYKTDLSSNDLWFTFKNLTKDVTIKKSESDTNNQIKLIKGTNPEFKINNDKLEKAWSADSLAKKVGLTCPATAESGDSGNKCTVETGKTVKFSEDGTNFKDFSSSSATAQTSNGITYTEDTQDYNQGFKFNVSTEVTGSDSNIKLATGDYEIKYEEGKGWYLAKKSTGG